MTSLSRLNVTVSFRVWFYFFNCYILDRKSGRIHADDDEDAFQTVEIKKRSGASTRTRTTAAPPRPETLDKPRTAASKQTGKTSTGTRTLHNPRAMQNRADMALIRAKAFRDVAVQFKANWATVCDIPLSELSADPVKNVTVEDVCWSGDLKAYNRSLDKAAPRNPAPLIPAQNTYPRLVETVDDVSLDLVTEDVTAIISDRLLAVLMAAPRSLYCWDVEATVTDGQILFDRRDAPSTTVDLSSVWETAGEPINSETNPHNTAVKLGQEAAWIETCLLEQAVDNQVLQKGERVNAFTHKAADLKVAPPSTAFRYRKFTLPGNADYEECEIESKPMSVLVRCAVNAAIERVNPLNTAEKSTQLVNVHAFTEFDLKGILSFRSHLGKQSGAIYSSELRNNATKVFKWVAAAHLASVDSFKLAFVSRLASKENNKHHILSVQSETTDELKRIVDFDEAAAWSPFRVLCDALRRQGNGSYVLVFEPLRHAVRIGKMPEEGDGVEHKQ